MDEAMIRRLTAWASVMLPPATVMRLECLADTTQDPALISLLEEIQGRALRGERVCDEPCEAVVFPDRVLLRCHGCARFDHLPHVAGVGCGHDEAEARENALYALTLPLDHPNTRRPGCIAAQRWGEGPVQRVILSCILNRVAYAPAAAAGSAGDSE